MSKQQRIIPGIQMPTPTLARSLEDWVEQKEHPELHLVDVPTDIPAGSSSRIDSEFKTPSKRPTKRLMIEIDADLARKMKLLAVQRDVTMSKIAEHAIRMAFDVREQQ